MPKIGLIAQSLAFSVVSGVVLFVSAGRINIPAFWIYLLLWMVTCLLGIAVIDPALFEERMRPGGRSINPAYGLLFLPMLGHWVLAGLDVGRRHWSDGVPPVLQWMGMLVFAGALALSLWAMHVNRFFSSVVRIQEERGHHLITGGPYRWLRHPGYTAGLMMCISSGIALGSWISVVPVLAGVPLLLSRTIREDRFLREKLPGYAAYSAKVHYRLVPGIW